MQSNTMSSREESGKASSTSTQLRNMSRPVSFSLISPPMRCVHRPTRSAAKPGEAREAWRRAPGMVT